MADLALFTGCTLQRPMVAEVHLLRQQPIACNLSPLWARASECAQKITRAKLRTQECLFEWVRGAFLRRGERARVDSAKD